MRPKKIERKDILKAVSTALEPLDFVYGMWECGSSAFDRIDNWSDVDIVVDVEDDRVKDVFEYADKALGSLSEIEYSYFCKQPMSPGAYQKAYKLKGASEFLVVELCALRHSEPRKFLEKEIHSDVKIHFDKKNVTENRSIDKKEYIKKIHERIEDIENMFNIYQFLVKKELNRENYIEALEFYRNFSLNPLVELLRIKHKPYRYNFKARYIYYDLPKPIVSRLHDFYYIKDGFDLYRKHRALVEWFNEALQEVKSLNLCETLK